MKMLVLGAVKCNLMLYEKKTNSEFAPFFAKDSLSNSFCTCGVLFCFITIFFSTPNSLHLISSSSSPLPTVLKMEHLGWFSVCFYLSLCVIPNWSPAGEADSLICLVMSSMSTVSRQEVIRSSPCEYRGWKVARQGAAMSEKKSAIFPKINDYQATEADEQKGCRFVTQTYPVCYTLQRWRQDRPQCSLTFRTRIS